MYLHQIEIALILFVIGIQIYVSIQLVRKIKNLKDLDLHNVFVRKIQLPIEFLRAFDYSRIIKYSNNELEEDELSDSALVNSDILCSENKSIDSQNIIEEINTYILKNDKTVINFNVIRDITNRNIEVLDDDINQQLPTPLYLGLAATMLGIVFGLWGMETQSVESSAMLDNIGVLIQGVGTAMVASFMGVLLTTILSAWLYKNAKREADKETNKFFSLLQAVLLPEMLGNGETGVEQLNKNLSRFAKIASASVEKLSSITTQSTETVKLQNDLMERVDNMNVRRISKTNLELFERIENNLGALDKFNAYWERLNSSLVATNELVTGLRDLNSRLGNVDVVAEKIQDSIDNYQITMRFFTEHLSILKDGNKNVKQMVSKADLAFAEAIDELKKNTIERITQLKKGGGDFDAELKSIRDEIVSSLAQTTQNHMEQLSKTYNDNIPRFSKLDQLDELPGIKNELKASRREEENNQIVERLDKLITQNALLLSKGLNHKNSDQALNKQLGTWFKKIIRN